MNPFIRNRKDAEFSAKFPLPAAGATSVSPAFDLEQMHGGELEHVAAVCEIPALAALRADGLTVTVQDSDDGVTFADCRPVTLVTVEGSPQGSAADATPFRFHPTTRRYVRVEVAVATGAGNVTAAQAEFNLLF